MFIRPAPSFVNEINIHFIGRRTRINWIIKPKSQRIEHGKHWFKEVFRNNLVARNFKLLLFY